MKKPKLLTPQPGPACSGSQTSSLIRWGERGCLRQIPFLPSLMDSKIRPAAQETYSFNPALSQPHLDTARMARGPLSGLIQTATLTKSGNTKDLPGTDFRRPETIAKQLYKKTVVPFTCGYTCKNRKCCHKTYTHTHRKDTAVSEKLHVDLCDAKG